MKTITHSLLALAAPAILAVAVQAGPSSQFWAMLDQTHAANQPSAGRLVSLTAEDPSWVAQALADYPLQTCVVSGEKLGSSGQPLDYAFVQAGKPARLVRFSSLESVNLFVQNPTQYLRALDNAAKTRVVRS